MSHCVIQRHHVVEVVGQFGGGLFEVLIQASVSLFACGRMVLLELLGEVFSNEWVSIQRGGDKVWDDENAVI